MGYLTLSLPFSTSGTVAGRLLSTAWLFKIASHRLLNVTKFTPVLPSSDIGWKNMFRKLVYGVIPNRRYADGVVALVRGSEKDRLASDENVYTEPYCAIDEEKKRLVNKIVARSRKEKNGTGK